LIVATFKTTSREAKARLFRVTSTGKAGAMASNRFDLKSRSVAQPASEQTPAGAALTKHWIKLLTATAASALFASSVAALALAGAAKTGAARVAIAKTPLGRVLVDSKGITLYDFVKDKGTTSTCYGACAALWPPLITKGKPIAGPGVRVSLLGTTKRKDGKLEVTYNGHPLYYFVTDRKPGQTTGQGVDQFGAPWWVLSPAGKEIHRG
jgi:predicted lipoprotein with Yx(FWY)xxD motif